MTSLTERTVLITGASRGLGLALARQLAGRGWQLIIDGRNPQALKAVQKELARLSFVTAIGGDVADPAHRRALAIAARAAGGLDAVINNASILGSSPQPELLDYPLETLEQVYRVNVLAPLGLLQAVRSELKPEARIINITSDAGVEAYPGWGGYGSSKAALEQLSAILAAENPRWRVYWVDPGDMRTQMQQEAFPGEDISDRPLPEESIPGLIELLEGDRPSGRYRAREMDAAESAEGVQELRVAMTVDNLDEAVEFYHTGLGLPIVDQWASPEGRGFILAAGQATLELVDPPQANLIDQVEVGRRVAGPVRLAFEVPNVETATTALENKGARPLNGRVQTPWGDLNQRLQAPDGMQLTLFQLPTGKVAAN
jgi:NAD(P)-dependent dehydrogenase (short-subunit alcohol dehydrogenase family)